MAARAFVWIGGALFAVALSWCAWWFLFDAGRTAPFAGAEAVAIDTALFSVFAVHHSLFARNAVRRWLRIVPVHLMRSMYVYAASLLLIGVCVGWQRIGGEVYRATGIAAVALAAVQLAGVVIIARAVARIDPLELAGIRAEVSHGGLQVDGPYRWVRHPLYLGWTIAVFATPHLTGDRLAFASVSTAYLIVAVPWEERALARAFPGDYVRYQTRVRWRIVPFIY